MEVTLIIKKNTGTNRVIETPVESYTNRDSAVLKCAVLNRDNKEADASYHLCDLNHNDCEVVEVVRCDDSLFIQDEDGNEVEVDVTTESDVFEDKITVGVYDIIPFVKVDTVEIYGTRIDHLNISDELKRQINHEADNIAEWLTEQIEP